MNRKIYIIDLGECKEVRRRRGHGHHSAEETKYTCVGYERRGGLAGDCYFCGVFVGILAKVEGTVGLCLDR